MILYHNIVRYNPISVAYTSLGIHVAADRYGRRWTHLSGWYIGLLLPVLLLIFAYFASDGASLNQKAIKYTDDTAFSRNASTDISHLKFVLAPPLKSCASACASLGLACDSLEFLSNANMLQAFALSSHSWCSQHSSMSPTACNFTKWPVVCEHVFTVDTGSARINLGSRNCSKPLPRAEPGMAKEGACDTQGYVSTHLSVMSPSHMCPPCIHKARAMAATVQVRGSLEVR